MRNTSLTSVPRSAVAWCALTALIVSSWAVAAGAAELRPTKDFADIAAAVDRYVEKYGAEHVLLVLDIDNTIMAMNQDLGSDHWFEWQNYLLKHEPDSPYLVADTFPGLLEVQGILYDVSQMHPPEPQQPGIIAELQEKGVSTIALTSRGPEYRVATERELKRCGYDIAATALAVQVPGGTYLAYDPTNPEKDGLTAAELKTYKLEEPRPVSYANGIFMTAGQHKGVMLLTLLHHTDRDIKAVIYVDDNVRHVGTVFSAAVDRHLEITSFQYQHEDVRAQRFQYSDKGDITRQWHQLATAPIASSTSASTTTSGVSAGCFLRSSPAIRKRCRRDASPSKCASCGIDAVTRATSHSNCTKRSNRSLRGPCSCR
jgi:hypothetical protein